MSEPFPCKHLLSEAELLRRLNLTQHRASKLRLAGILTPDTTAQGGHVRLYRFDRLTELSAKINPQPTAV